MDSRGEKAGTVLLMQFADENQARARVGDIHSQRSPGGP